jgi:hypothetical protein
MPTVFSKKRLAVLTVGLAIGMSSCGIQNQAGDSSGDAIAAGRTKNSALGEWCLETVTKDNVDIDRRWINGWGSIRQFADFSERPANRNRYRWANGKTKITDVYGPSIVKCDSLKVLDLVRPEGVTSAEELPQEFVENSTANQCISIEDRKKTLRGYDEQIMAHSLDADKTIYEQMKTGRWVTTVQRPCNEPAGDNSFSKLACVSVSHKAFEVAFYDEQYELYKDQAGTPYLDLIIIGKEKANSLITC